MRFLFLQSLKIHNHHNRIYSIASFRKSLCFIFFVQLKCEIGWERIQSGPLLRNNDIIFRTNTLHYFILRYTTLRISFYLLTCSRDFFQINFPALSRLKESIQHFLIVSRSLILPVSLSLLWSFRIFVQPFESSSEFNVISFYADPTRRSWFYDRTRKAISWSIVNHVSPLPLPKL